MPRSLATTKKFRSAVNLRSHTTTFLSPGNSCDDCKSHRSCRGMHDYSYMNDDADVLNIHRHCRHCSCSTPPPRSGLDMPLSSRFMHHDNNSPVTCRSRNSIARTHRPPPLTLNMTLDESFTTQCFTTCAFSGGSRSAHDALVAGYDAVRTARASGMSPSERMAVENVPNGQERLGSFQMGGLPQSSHLTPENDTTTPKSLMQTPVRSMPSPHHFGSDLPSLAFPSSSSSSSPHRKPANGASVLSHTSAARSAGLSHKDSFGQQSPSQSSLLATSANQSTPPKIPDVRSQGSSDPIDLETSSLGAQLNGSRRGSNNTEDVISYNRDSATSSEFDIVEASKNNPYSMSGENGSRRAAIGLDSATLGKREGAATPVRVLRGDSTSASAPTSATPTPSKRDPNVLQSNSLAAPMHASAGEGSGSPLASPLSQPTLQSTAKLKASYSNNNNNGAGLTPTSSRDVALTKATSEQQPRESRSRKASSLKRDTNKTVKPSPSMAALRSQSERHATGDASSNRTSRVASIRPTPQLPSASNQPQAPPPTMYWSRASVHGSVPRRGFRAHTASLADEIVWIFGGCDIKSCFRELWCFDTETMCWSKPRVTGELPPCRRAHSATMVDKRLFVFGGGDGPLYFNDLYIFDTVSLQWSKPTVSGTPPLPRRAHTCNLYNGKLVIFGGGNGVGALNDVCTLDVTDPSRLEWRKMECKGKVPIGRGYHTSNLVDGKLIVIGGSDGSMSFNDIFILSLDTQVWHQVKTDEIHDRLGHTATQVGSYLFVIGGHDSTSYTPGILTLNLVNLQWEPRRVCGSKPPGRGYHQAWLRDSRLFVHGGFDGKEVFDDFYIVDLGASAYLPQITSFKVEVSRIFQTT